LKFENVDIKTLKINDVKELVEEYKYILKNYRKLSVIGKNILFD